MPLRNPVFIIINIQILIVNDIEDYEYILNVLSGKSKSF